MKNFLFFFFILLGFYAQSQAKVEIIEKDMRVSGTFIYYDDSGKIITHKEHTKMVNSQQYILSFQKGGGDTLNCLLRAKDPARYIGKKIAPRTFQDVNGKAFNTGRKRHVTVLVFWGDRCASCINLIDGLDSLAMDYKRVDFIALATYGDVKQFAARHPWKNIRVPLEYKGEFNPYFPEPCVAIIDRHGVLRQMYWENNLEEVTKFLRAL